MDERRVENIRKFFDKVARDDPVHGYVIAVRICLSLASESIVLCHAHLEN